MVVLDLMAPRVGIFVPTMIRGNKSCGCMGKGRKEGPVAAAIYMIGIYMYKWEIVKVYRCVSEIVIKSNLHDALVYELFKQILFYSVH